MGRTCTGRLAEITYRKSQYLGIFNTLFRLPKVLIFSTPQEQAFVNHRFGTANVAQDIVGVGVDVPSEVSAARFLTKHHAKLRGNDFVLNAGRIDAARVARNSLAILCSWSER